MGIQLPSPARVNLDSGGLRISRKFGSLIETEHHRTVVFAAAFGAAFHTNLSRQIHPSQQVLKFRVAAQASESRFHV